MRNFDGAGRIAVPPVTHAVESELLYPFIRGRDVGRWRARPSCLYLLTHEAETRRAIGEREMCARYPQAHAYLSNFREQLLSRKSAPLRQQMEGGPFYSVLGVGPHTVSRWKVVFKDLTDVFQCCVVGPGERGLPGRKPIIADSTLRLIPATCEAEAHYLAGLLNSTPCLAALYYSSAGVQTQRYHAGDAEKVAIAAYAGTPAQEELASLSRACHAAVREGDPSMLAEAEARLDECAAAYWRLTPEELRAVRDDFAHVRRPAGI